MTAPARYRISISAGLVLGVVALVVLTAALIHIPWSLTARANVRDLTLKLNAELIENARAKMNALLDDTMGVERVIVASLSRGAVDIEAENRLESLFLSFLHSHPAVSAIEFGRLNDRSLAVRRLTDGAIAAEQTTPGEPYARRQTVRYDIRGEDMRRSERRLSEAGYSVTDQFWFKQAFETSGVSWSDIYRNPVSNQLGFTAVSAVTAPSGDIGVVATSMELGRISAFLSDISGRDAGTVFLTNIYGELVALEGELPLEEGATPDTATAVKLSEAPSPQVRMAERALRAGGVSLRDLKGSRQLVYNDSGDAGAFFVTVSPLSQMGLVVGLIVPEAEILGRIDGNTQRLAYLLVLFIATIAAIVSQLAAWTLGKPLASVTRSARLLGDFRFGEIAPVSSRLTEIGALSQAIGQMSASLASFKKYVPTEVVRTLFAQGMEAELGGTRRELTILFMDLANFTQIAEAKGDAVIPFLGEFLSEMSEVIREGGGTIDKYIGDAIMSFWNAPVANESHALCACRTALSCQARLRAIRSRNPAEGAALRARIGINTGKVLVGNVGSSDRLNYTAIGDPVNVAARLEPLNKRYASEILIGEDTYAGAKDHIVARRLDRVAVYGKSEGVQIFELLALAREASPALLEWVSVYEQAVLAFHHRAWDEAELLFERVIALRGGEDGPSRLMIERIAECRRSPPTTPWGQTLKLTEK